MDKNLKVFAAELIGTAVLMIGGPGSAILAAKGIGGALGVALAFGFSLMILAYAIGGISGCHINPAVSIGMWIARRIKTAELVYYIVAQLVGAFLGGLIIWIIAPWIPSSVMEKIPSTTKPRWLTDEYATNFFTSVCTIATNAPYTIPITASVARSGVNWNDA